MAATDKSSLFQQLPSTDEVLRQPAIRTLIEREGQSAVTDGIRVVLSRLRQEIAAEAFDERSLRLALEGLNAAIERQVRLSLSYSLMPLINATGVILHTNLGRAPLAAGALDHVRAASAAYSNLEFNLATGERGRRDVHVDRLFRKLLDSEADQSSHRVSTIVVNNNAAAVLLALNSLAEGCEVIVSRGELVEIGGSFRVPDVMKKSGAILREVGTTNRTRIADYEAAIVDCSNSDSVASAEKGGGRSCLLLRVHRSNFEITGFTEQPTLEELVDLAQRYKIPLIEDLGSGALVDLRSVGVNGEPGVLESLRAGVDVVTYSGDKLLGGPQAGLISGRSDLVARMRANSLFRALRVDKLTYAALEATLLSYVKRDHGSVPVLRMLRLSKDEITLRAQAIIGSLQSSLTKPLLQAELVSGESVIGGGAAPSAVLPTCSIALRHSRFSPDGLNDRLRAASAPVIARVEDGRVLLDLRTVFPEQDATLATVLAELG